MSRKVTSFAKDFLSFYFLEYCQYFVKRNKFIDVINSAKCVIKWKIAC